MNYCYNMLVLRRKNPGKFITLTVSDTTVINVFVSLKKRTNKKRTVITTRYRMLS